MKVKLKKDRVERGITQDKVYEVFTIQCTRKTEKMSCGTMYYIYNDNEYPAPYKEEDFDIVDGRLDSDFVVKNEDMYDAIYIMPESVGTDMFYYWIVETEEVRITKDFINRFRYLVSEKKYAEICAEEFHDPEIKIVAEAIGDNWVICPECNEAFEVNPNEGVVKCIGCYTKMNNPYAKEFPQKEDEIL